MNPFLERPGCLVLDAGLATSLEARGFDLDHPLWSARMLLEAPDEIRAVHEEFLAAGADCITTASYQATLEGFRRAGATPEVASGLLLRSVELAKQARDRFWSRSPPGRLRPLVAASVGPYGAFLADGSEYSGAYGLNEGELHAFHRRRWEILASAGADLLACETIPSLVEARALLRLLEATPGVSAWMSFTCRDGEALRDGTPFAAAVLACDPIENVAAVGVNCTAPKSIAALVRAAREHTDKPVIVYPNSGEIYDAPTGKWSGSPQVDDWVDLAPGWIRLGVAAIGGCCRTDAADLVRLRERIETTRPEA
jgi:homocysteine S-methyltransferase